LLRLLTPRAGAARPAGLLAGVQPLVVLLPLLTGRLIVALLLARITALSALLTPVLVLLLLIGSALPALLLSATRIVLLVFHYFSPKLPEWARG
jgi:hypothetical protein